MSYKVNVNIIISQQARTLRALSAFSIRVKKSIHSLVETAMVQLPITARLEKEGTLLPSEETAKVFAEGDAVEIQLGHDNTLKTEFKGFINRVNFSDPCTLELEGYSWQLKRKAEAKSWKSVKVKEVLNLLIAGTGITIHPDTTDVELKPFSIQNENGIQVIESIKKASDEYLVAYFIDGNQLYVGPENFALRDQVVKYKLGWNTLQDEELKLRHADDVKVKVNYCWRDKKGKRHHGSAGKSGGIEINYNDLGRFPDAETAKTKALALSQLKQYEGYEGRVTALLVPYCQPGWKASVLDDQYKEREGGYIVEGVTVILDGRGDERIVEIGKKISK